MKKIGIIHTTPATIESLKQMISDTMEYAEVINILDDSILPDMCAGNHVELVRKRWIVYARILEEQGADVVLSACSTVGEFAEQADKIMGIPVLRIDDGMAEKAVSEGSVISVLATLRSTLEPTVRLIEKKAEAAFKNVTVHTVLVEGAYDALIQGDKGAHDKKIREAAAAHMESSDVIVLAQASMASAITDGKNTPSKIITSPALGIEKLKRILESGKPTIR